MSMRYPGGFIASTPVTAAYPSGVWTQAQAAPYQAQNVWTRDQFWPYTTLLLQGDGATNGAQNNTFLDSSSNNFTITRNGNTTQGSFTPYEQDGYWSNYFNGSSSLSANLSGVAAGTSTFTFEVWVFLTAYPGSDAPFYDTRSTNGASTTGMQFGVYSTGALKFYDGTETNLGGTVPLNQWAHIALVRNGSNVMTAYINGTATGTTVSSTRNFTDQYFWIGSVPGPASPYINAYFSNLRWVVGTAVYTSNFTPSASPLTAITNTKLLTCQSNRFKDNSTNNFTLTVNGSPSVQAFQPFPGATTWSASVLGGSGYYDGSGDYLSAPNNTALDLASGDFTVECWFYVTSVAAARPLIGRNNGNVATQSDLQYGIYLQSGGNVVVRPYQGGVTDYTTVVGTAVVNAWNHVALVRTGNTFYGFLNGVRGGTSQTISGALNTGSWLTYIGAGLSSGLGNDWMLGYIGDTRVVKGTALYTGTTYTVPTAPLTAIANTSLLLSATNSGIFDAAVMNDLETVGNAQVSTSVVKYGTGSMAFDGSGDNLSLISQPPLYLSTGDFTIEMWLYTTTATTVQQIFIRRSSAAARGMLMNISGVTSQKITFLAGDTNTAAWEVSLTSGTSLASNTWYHVAVTRNGNNFTLWLNGVSEATASSSVTIADDTSNFLIGVSDGASNYLNGYLDDFRITKGAARYIGNFTPPIARLPAQ